MNNSKTIIGICILLLLVGCNTQDCVNDKAENKILIYEYRQEHTLRECFEYCDNSCYKTFYGKDGWTDEYCVELCK